MTWHSHWNAERKSEDPWQFAFGKPWEGTRNRAHEQDQAPSYELIDWIRHHSDYLRPHFSLGSISMALLVLVNITVSLAIYFACLTLALLIAYSPDCYMNSATVLGECGSERIFWLLFKVAEYGLPLFVIAHVIAASATWRKQFTVAPLARIRYRMRTGIGKSATWAGVAVAGLASLASLPYVEGTLFSSEGAYWWTIILVALVGFAFLANLKSGINDATRSLAAAPRPARLRIIVFSASIVYLSAVLCFWLVRDQNLAFVVGICIIAFLIGALINSNYFGLHRFYRDRLTETFLADESSVQDNIWGPARHAEDGCLSKIGGANDPGLYHLINTNLVINGHKRVSWGKRGCDNFVFSHAFCGSSVTGWFKTGDLGNRDSTLGTAMAISGAAVNPSAGTEGTMTRNWFVTAAMRFLNIRLGYWLENPLPSARQRIGPLSLWPNFINPGVWCGLIGGNSIEDSAFLELTDGGHFDNTGIYELIRRRLRLIILVDAGADPDFRFDDISNVIEKVRADFGTTIEFLEDRGLDDLVPRSGGDDAFLTRLGFARRGHAVARIYYRKNPEGERDETGLLVIVKPTIVAGLPHDIYNYRAGHDTFPGQSTANQFFTERQLEAYRELAYQLTRRMVDDAEVTDWFPDYIREKAGNSPDAASEICI